MAKITNVLGKLPRRIQQLAKTLLSKITSTANLHSAVDEIGRFMV
jgi:hypothetical protein